MRDAVHLNFDRDGDLLLDFFRGAARPLGDHLNPGVGDVGIGFHRQLLEGDDAPNKKQQRDAQNDEAVVQREIDERANHYCSTVFWNSSALATTCWPGRDSRNDFLHVAGKHVAGCDLHAAEFLVAGRARRPNRDRAGARWRWRERPRESPFVWP